MRGITRVNVGIKSLVGPRNLIPTRNASHIAMAGDVHLSSRRVMRKIKLGKARPAMFHQFDTLVELSDGSVIRRRSQAPKDEIRMISDMRNSALWNPRRSDLSTADPNATGKVNRFNQRFGDFTTSSEPATEVVAEESESAASDLPPAKTQDDLLQLLGQNAKQVLAGGVLYDKKKNRNRDRR